MSSYFLNLVLVTTSLTINIIASVVMIKKKSLKPFQLTSINILFLNILYEISRLPVVLIFVTSPKHGIVDSNYFKDFPILIEVFITHANCLFVTFLTFQRLVAVTYSPKFQKWITKRIVLKVSMVI